MKAIKFPKIFTRKKKLRAATTRRATASGADFDDLSEPNMKLSRALLIVLLLHVVAVAGIIAFNAIKTRQGSAAAVPAPPTTNLPSSTLGSIVRAAPAASPTAIAQKGNARPVANESGKASRAKQTDTAKAAADSGRIYTVAKGDNPVTIAKKFKVSYDDLISLNHIDDPRKLQIGQKLLIPTKTDKQKKTGE